MNGKLCNNYACLKLCDNFVYKFRIYIILWDNIIFKIIYKDVEDISFKYVLYNCKELHNSLPVS